MKKYNKQNSSGMKKNIISRLFSEKTLLVGFAFLSLAFGLFYTLDGNIGFAQSNNGAAETIIPTNDNSNSTESTADAANVVAKALAFKAMLTTTQQATLEKTYTSTLARRWSNLPCGSTCRNGIQFSTLTTAQQTAALEVIAAAAGTTANEGSDEFNQIRFADGFLNQSGGGSNYGAGIYFIAFLNTPSTTGAWMLQFGGHHYGANFAYNQGRVVGTTPIFEAVEPIAAFTFNGGTYQPLLQERTNLANMLASLTTAQLTTARLTQTFSDVVMSPGESNGGTATFPAIAQGLAVSTLTDAQKLLVLEAMKPWVRDADDTVAANLLTIYQNELNSTYIAYTGNGTSGNASSFLNANTNYARIAGPSVWVEFICQNGAVLSGIHYHTVFRDRQRDYGQDLSLTVPLDNPPTTTKKRFDFDGDGKADISVYRPGGGNWFVQGSTAGFTAYTFGASTDTIVPGDYDGDGKTDYAVFRPSNGTWYVQRSTSGFAALAFGASTDIPVPGDYDGDGKTDYAVFRPSNGTWYIQGSTTGFSAVVWGLSTDKTVPGDYDGDGKTDVAVYRPSNGTWYINGSTAGFTAFVFGASTDTVVPADYDGDGKTDVAVWRANSGIWYIQGTTAGFSAVTFGASTDLPTPADYDGDGKADVAVFRPSNGTWYLQNSTSGFSALAFGASTDLPIPNAYVR